SSSSTAARPPMLPRSQGVHRRRRPNRAPRLRIPQNSSCTARLSITPDNVSTPTANAPTPQQTAITHGPQNPEISQPKPSRSQKGYPLRKLLNSLASSL